jgi:hypothetical protein
MENINKYIAQLIVSKEKKYIYQKSPDVYEQIRYLYHKALAGNVYSLDAETLKLVNLLNKQPNLMSENEQKKDLIMFQFDEMARKCCHILGLKIESLKTKVKSRTISEARQIIWRLAMENIDYAPIKSSHVAKMFGEYFNRNRVTVLYGVNLAKYTIYNEYNQLYVDYFGKCTYHFNKSYQSNLSNAVVC